MKEKAANVGEKIRAVSPLSVIIEYMNKPLLVGERRPHSNIRPLYLHGSSFAGPHVFGVMVQTERDGYKHGRGDIQRNNGEYRKATEDINHLSRNLTN